MKKLLFVVMCSLTCILTLNGCMVIGLTNDYGKLNKEEKALVQPWGNAEEHSTGNIYLAHAGQIREAMKNYPKTMVYIFSNGCPHAPGLCIVEAYAKTHGLQLFMVMTGYGLLGCTLEQKPDYPLYVIDNAYYKRRISYRYLELFKQHLLEDALKSSGEGSVYLFSFDSLQAVFGIDLFLDTNHVPKQ